jgi:uncharacterized protein (TIGR02145 family)
MENVKDIDGNSYKTVRIGDQIWMAENLKVTHYRNGDPIPNLMDGLNRSNWDKNSWKGEYCNYDNDEDNVNIYGRLYNGFVVNDEREFAPKGWHVSTDEEWMELEMALGMSESEAKRTGYRGTNQGSQLVSNSDLWNHEPTLRQLTGEATILMDGYNLVGPGFETSGFSALPGGCWSNYGQTYCGKFYYCHFWTSTKFSDDYFSMSRRLNSLKQGVTRPDADYWRHGFSVRCIKD